MGRNIQGSLMWMASLFQWVFPLLALSLLSGCYSLSQVYHQGNLLATRRPVGVLLWERETPPKLKADLRRVQEILEFSRKSGLNVGGAYSTYIQSPTRAVSYIVQASPPLRMESKTWWFPFVGRVPYLGYFNEESRDKKARLLQQEGFDVATSDAGAFSSLGWYDDPVYSPMLKRSKSSLAHLLFHELTHRTFWIDGETELNEHMAEFVASELTVAYLKGAGASEVVDEYMRGRKDRSVYRKWLAELRGALESLYQRKDLMDEEKKAQKKMIFKQYTTEKFPRSLLSSPYRSLRDRPWNNAVVMASSLYQPDTTLFQRAFHCHKFSNMGAFLNELKKQVDNSDKKPIKVLENFCPKGTM